MRDSGDYAALRDAAKRAEHGHGDLYGWAPQVLALLDEVEMMARIMRRIRSGWLPRRLPSGSWWWGRPSTDDGFRLWSEGLVPTMAVGSRMTDSEVAVWVGSLNSLAPENDGSPSDAP